MGRRPQSSLLAETLAPPATVSGPLLPRSTATAWDNDHRERVVCTGTRRSGRRGLSFGTRHFNALPQTGDARQRKPACSRVLLGVLRRAHFACRKHPSEPMLFERPGGPFPNLTPPCVSTTFMCDASEESFLSVARSSLGNNGRRSHDATGKCLCPRGRARERFGKSGSSKLITDWPRPHVELCRGPTSSISPASLGRSK